jgi:hypothetical protein
MFARHPSTIQKLTWPSRRANAFRNLPDGEAAKLEEAQQQAEHEEWHRNMEDRCSQIHLTFGVAGNPYPRVQRSLGAQRLHNINARSASRGQH